jgi:hypothetical protein
VYCGSTADITAEHVFPANLFPRPKSKNLITVPACGRCNQGFGLDDEYFRFFAVLPAYENDIGRQMWDAKIVGSTFKRSPGLKAAIAKTIREVEVASPAGIHLGKQHAVLVDKERVDRMFEKIARGLFRHHFGRRLSSVCPFDIRVNVRADSLAASGLSEDLGPTVSLGDGSVVRYRFSDVIGQPNTSVWAINLYSATVTVVITDSAADAQ